MAKKKKSGPASADTAQPESLLPGEGSVKSSSAGTGAGNVARPLYAQVEVLNAARHADLRLVQAKDVMFAAGLNSIRLAGIELPQAATCYPVVFAETGGDWAAYAVTGHSNGKNEFVADDGQWRAGNYVPAFVRRYPFILSTNSQDESLSLAADLSSAMLSVVEGQPLYEEGKPSKTALAILKFCTSYHDQIRVSGRLFRQIADTGILQSRRAEVTLADGERRVIEGFHTVDESRLNALKDNDFLELRKSGALNLIYCHLWSMRSWKQIL
jgi:hypothetical protein